MYLGLETLSFSLYALVAFDRNSATSAESAMKYFVLGAIASGALLYGISWIYGMTGSLQFHEIAEVIRTQPEINGVPLWFGVAFVIVGIGFKFGAVPDFLSKLTKVTHDPLKFRSSTRKLIN